MTSGRAAALVAVLIAAGVPWHGPLSLAAQTTPTPRVVKIVGDAHKLLLRADGTVAGWGRHLQGQLGPVSSLAAGQFGTTVIVNLEVAGRVVDIAAGTSTSYALLDDGTVLAWGAGEAGQLGGGPLTLPKLATSTGSMEYRGRETPTPVAGISDAVAITAAGDSAYAVLRDGTVRAWGGAGPAIRPVAMPDLTAVSALSAGGGHVLALTTDGRVFSWGSNFYGALGRPPRSEQAFDMPGQVTGLTEVAQVVAGSGVSTALKKDGTVWVWGSNWQQQFGFPAPTDQPGPTRGWMLEPQLVPGVTGVTAIALGLTGRHTLALLKDSTLRVWGNNDWGQLGTGAGPGFQPRPVAIKVSGVTAVFAAGNNSFAVRTDGSLWAWGAGDAQRFPLTSNVRVPAPAPAGLK
ncbi:MAG: hypothetical protein JNL48_08325 [Acidobacteria bacterium]|nr:hypothetical protein [Acidobacteriota bacterium]